MPNRRQVATRAIVAAGVYLHPNYYVGDQRQETRGNPVGFTNRRHDPPPLKWSDLNYVF